MKRIDPRWFWIILGVAALIVRYFLSFCPECTEQWYSRGLFLLVRNIIDHSFALSPVAMVYFFFPLLLFFLYRWIKRSNIKTQSLRSLIINFIFSATAFFSAIVFLFLFLWGYNYGRVPLEKHLGIKAQPVKVQELKRELDHYTQQIIEARMFLSEDSLRALSGEYLMHDLEKGLRMDMERLLSEKGFPTPGRVRGRLLRPKGALLRFSTAGVYFPLTGECHIDSGLHPLQIPFVFLHELAHGFGFTDEGSCNFLAFLAGIESEQPFVRYSAYLGYWRYLAGAYKDYYPDVYAEFRAKLPQAIRKDLDVINETLYKYPDWFPKLRYHAYETYLKAQGISEGIENYNRVIMLATAWRKQSQADQ